LCLTVDLLGLRSVLHRTAGPSIQSVIATAIPESAALAQLAPNSHPPPSHPPPSNISRSRRLPPWPVLALSVPANDAPAAATAPKAPADASADEVDAASDAAATRPVGGGFGANARARTHSMAGEPHESDLSMCPPQGSLSRPPFVCWTAREARSAQSRSMLCA